MKIKSIFATFDFWYNLIIVIIISALWFPTFKDKKYL